MGLIDGLLESLEAKRRAVHLEENALIQGVLDETQKVSCALKDQLAEERAHQKKTISDLQGEVRVLGLQNVELKQALTT